MDPKSNDSSTTQEALILGKAFLFSELQEKNERLDKLIATHEEQLKADREALRQEYNQQLKHLNTQAQQADRLQATLKRLVSDLSDLKQELSNQNLESKQQIMEQHRWLRQTQNTLGKALRFDSWVDGVIIFAGFTAIAALVMALGGPFAARLIQWDHRRSPLVVEPGAVKRWRIVEGY